MSKFELHCFYKYVFSLKMWNNGCFGTSLKHLPVISSQLNPKYLVLCLCWCIVWDHNFKKGGWGDLLLVFLLTKLKINQNEHSFLSLDVYFDFIKTIKVKVWFTSPLSKLCGIISSCKNKDIYFIISAAYVVLYIKNLCVRRPIPWTERKKLSIYN